MTTDDAFAGLVNSKYLWRKTGASDNLRRWYMHQLKHGRTIRLDTKVRLLEQAGFVLVASWRKPSVRVVTDRVKDGL